MTGQDRTGSPRTQHSTSKDAFEEPNVQFCGLNASTYRRAGCSWLPRKSEIKSSSRFPSAILAYMLSRVSLLRVRTQMPPRGVGGGKWIVGERRANVCI